MESLREIAEKLKREKSVAVVCHIRPDGDAIGSAVGLTLALQKLNIKVKTYCDDVIPQKFSFLGTEGFFNRVIEEGFSAYVAVDSAEITRIGEKNCNVFAKQINTYNIDHHVSNSRYAKYNCVIDSASNSENIFRLIKELGCDFDEKTAEFLLMGVMTDTGNFKHKSVTPSTFITASELLSFGADINKINYNMFTKQGKQRAKLFGLTMSNIRYLLDDRLAIGTVTQKSLKESGALLEDTEGFIDFIMGIDTVEVGICMTEMKNNLYKCSFRSKGADVNKVAGIFGGGGHVLASGCQISGEYEEVVDKLRYAVSQFLE